MQRELARILDANFNRAREGLRVAEEFARFIVEDRRLAEQAKQFRHQLAELARRADPNGQLLASRDTAGDLGTTLRTAGEQARGQVADVATAAAKRVGEALRVLCEYAKLAAPAIAAPLETLRYRFYDWEKWLAGSADRRRIAKARLYLLVTQSCCRDGDWQSAVLAALDGGADVIQLREKSLNDGELLARAGWLVEQCREADALSVINDRPDIARLADADGVHLGRDDLPVAAAREICKINQFIGVSTHSVDDLDATLAEPAGPDYVALGPMFATTTKPEYEVAGLDYAREAIARLAETGLPHVAIGGVSLDRLPALREAGVTMVAVCSAILSADDIAEACRNFKAAMQ